MEITADALTGPRVRLRELKETDLEELVAWWQDPAVLANQTSGPYHPRPSTGLAEQFRQWSRNDGTDAGFTVVTGEDERVAGHAALFGANAHMMLRYAFDELGLHRVQLVVNGFNERAQAAYRKAGFTEEGRSREAVFRAGRWHDLIHMGILDREFRARR